MTRSEEFMSAFSQMYFFKELVYDNLHFIDIDGENKELADLILNLGESVIAIQIKERNDSARTTDAFMENRWFSDRMKTAKEQIKNTIDFIRQGKLPKFRNKQGTEILIFQDAKVIPLVVFVNDSIRDYPHILEKHSLESISVNCMSVSDFQIMCKELVAPSEMVDYLKYRLDFYEKNGSVSFMIRELSNEDMAFSRPASRETLVHNYIIERYGINNSYFDKELFENFRWFIQQTSKRSLAGQDSFSTYSVILFMAQFRRDEIKAFWERLKLAIDRSRQRSLEVVGNMSIKDSYTVFFVSVPSEEYALPMDFLLEKAKETYNPKRILQVYVWWFNDTDFHIDYLLMDNIC